MPAGSRASAIDWLNVGLKVPLVISPSPRAVCTTWCARSTPPLSTRIKPVSARVGGFGEQRGLAGKIARAREIDGPCETRFERADGLVHVLAVQVHPGFEPQRVARAQAARPHAEAASAFHSAPARGAGTITSNPSSPV